MSSLDRMVISGMRSFSPDKAQFIKFNHPLTLILGPNGTGKTTIIECLRYVTTGESPPNSERGQAFVHDPKLAHDPEVKGSIKLKFKDTGGEGVTVTRSLVVIQKAKTLQVRSLDGTITRKNEAGQKYNISKRCTDIDREMVTMLGVSKAILNNVIFCHQEESNWPLSEGKALKNKFDDIFAATRFVKALEKLQAIKKEHDNEAKTITIELKYLGDNKIRATKLTDELRANESRLSALRDRTEKLNGNLSPIQKSLDDNLEKLSNYDKVQQELAKKQTEATLEEKSCKELKSKIVSEHSGTIEDISIEIQNFKSDIGSKEINRKEIEQNLHRLATNISNKSDELNNVMLDLGKFQTNAKNHDDLIRSRDELVKKICTRHNIKYDIPEGTTLPLSEFNKVYTQLRNRRKQLEEDEEQTKKMFDADESKLQKELDALKESHSRHSQTFSIRTKQIKDNKSEIGKIDNKLLEIKSSAEKLSVIQKNLDEKQKQLNEVTASLDEVITSNDMLSIQNEVEAFEKNVKALDAEMLRLHAQADVAVKLEVGKKEKKSKEDAIRKIKSKHEDTLYRLLKKVPSENVRETVAQFISTLKKKIKDDQSKLNDLKIEMAELENNRKTIKNELTKKEAELRENEDRVFKLCGSRDLEASISEFDTQIKDLHNEKGSFIGAQYLYNTYINKLKRSEPCCPLCHRDFSDKQDVDDLVSELNSKLKLLPSELESKQKNIEELQQKCNNLTELRPIKLRVTALTEECPQLKLKVRNFEEKIEECRTSFTELDKYLNEEQANLVLAESMNDDLVLWEQHTKELKKLQSEITEAEKKLGTVSDRTLTVVNEEKTEIQSMLSALNDSLQKKRKSLEDYRSRRNKLQVEVNELGVQQIQISQEALKANEFQNKRKQLEDDILKCEEETNNIVKQTSALQEEIKTLRAKIDALKVKKDTALGEFIKNHQDLKNSIENIDKDHHKIQEYVANGEAEKLKRYQERSEMISTQLKTDEDLKSSLNTKLQRLNKEIANQQTTLNNLDNCLSLKNKQNNLLFLTEEVKKLKSRLGGFDYRTLQKERKTLENKLSELNAKIAEERGVYKGLQSEIEKQKRDLNVDEYKNAVKNYTEKMISLKITKVTSTDLDKYYRALDGAIMQYHAMKMTEINKIIKELWEKTYKGNDIDYIEIRSEASEAKDASSKRQYNYKVIMIKGDIEQVMRGRCSAGQKVLACLIIRLALAETFCLQCGVMALDEPTTNLDKDNIDSLCDALAEIVEMRQSQRQFQLIVISHDEEFVNRLARTSGIENYHLMEKNKTGHSVIMECCVENRSLY